MLFIRKLQFLIELLIIKKYIICKNGIETICIQLS